MIPGLQGLLLSRYISVGAHKPAKQTKDPAHNTGDNTKRSLREVSGRSIVECGVPECTVQSNRWFVLGEDHTV